MNQKYRLSSINGFILLFISLFFAMTPLYAKMIPLKWGKGKKITHYILEIATDRQFHNVIETKKTADTSIRISLKPGVYYIRVSGVSTEGVQGYYSDTRTIEIKSQLKMKPPKIDERIVQVQEDQEAKKTSSTKIESFSTAKKSRQSKFIRDYSPMPESKPNPGVRLQGLMDKRVRWNSRYHIFLPDNSKPKRQLR